MKLTTTMKLTGVAAASALSMNVSQAEIKVNDNLAFSGYVSGSAGYTDTDDDSDSYMDVDAIKLQASLSLDKVTGTVSFHSFASHDPVLLDAYATYKIDDASSVTGGNFLSYLGYEAFDYPAMLQISYANPMAAIIPAYHSGVKYDYSSESLAFGVAVLDSVYGPTYYKGDGDLDNGPGFEAYVKFISGDTSVFAAVAHDNGVAGSSANQTTFDLWAQTLVGKVTLAGEVAYSTYDAGEDADSYFWLLLAMAPINDSWTITGRLSGGEDETLIDEGGDTPTFIKATVSPAVTLTPNLGLLFEYSYISYDNFGADRAHFLGAQAIFKF